MNFCKSIKKRVGIGLLCLLLVCNSAFAINARKVNAQEEVSGEIQGIKWNIDSNGKLTIDGRNATGEYMDVDEPLPWYNYRDRVKTAQVVYLKQKELCNLFAYCDKMTSVDLRGLDTSEATDLSYMFFSCQALQSVDVSGFRTSNVTTMSHMFGECYQLKSLNLDSFDTSNVWNMTRMFISDYRLTSCDFSHFNTAKVTDMSWMFAQTGFRSLDLRNFDTSNVVKMDEMFYAAADLESLKIDNFNTSKVQDMASMFGGATRLKEVDVSHFDTSKVKNMNCIFSGCKSLSYIDMGNWNLEKVENKVWHMMHDCLSLTRFRTPRNYASSWENAYPLQDIRPDVTWYDEQNQEYQKLPQNQTGSKTLSITKTEPKKEETTEQKKEEDTGTVKKKEHVAVSPKAKTFVYKKVRYAVQKKGKKCRTAVVCGLKSKKQKQATVYETVIYKKKKYRVTAVADKAFSGYARLKRLTIRNSMIKRVGSGRFSARGKKVTVLCPGKKKKLYKKLFRQAGYRNIKIKKLR